MITDLISLMKALKEYFENDRYLSYIETVSIRKYEKGNLPEFDKYALIISPKKSIEELIANRTKQDSFILDIVCIVRNFDSEKSLVGTGNGEQGIIILTKNVQKSLFDFGEANSDELNILYDETENAIDFSIQKYPDRKDFFHEQIISYFVRLKHKIF